MEKDELPVLDGLLAQGKANGVLDLSIISGEEMCKREPKLNPMVKGALWSKNGGLCDPLIATIAAVENAVSNGVTLELNARFEDFIIQARRIVGVKSNRSTFGCRWVVNAAGLYADEIMHKAGVHHEFTITPRRGEYFLMDGTSFPLRNLLAPVPSKISKGIAVKPIMDGHALIGANAQDITDKQSTEITREGLIEVWKGASWLVPTLPAQHALAVFAGLRASGNAPCQNRRVNYNSDFIIEVAEEIQGLINLAGIESPGLTAAPAIAVRVIELLQQTGERLTEKSNWNPKRPTRPQFGDLSPEERAGLLKKARYQKVPGWFSGV
jgi:glycerol-3-phosphate dehydrogenase